MSQIALSDPDKIHVLIRCISCHKSLWKLRVLKRTGDKVVSSEYLPMTDDVPRFSEKIARCPFCSKRFYKKSKEAQVYEVQDVATGQVLTI